MPLTLQKINENLTTDGQLNLKDMNLSINDIKVLCAFIKDNNKVQRLNLRGNRIADESVIHLSAVLKDSQVQALELGANNIGTKGAKALALALKDSQILKLGLGFNNIGTEGAKALGAALKDSQVQTLDLRYNKIGDEGAKALASALKDSQVQILMLSWNNIDLEGIKALASAIKNSLVQAIDLDSGFRGDLFHSHGLKKNNIGAEGAKVLASVLKDSQVQTLILREDIGKEGAKAILQGLKDTYVTKVRGFIFTGLKKALEDNKRRLQERMIAFGEGLAKRHSELPVETFDLITQWLPENYHGCTPKNSNEYLFGKLSTASAIAVSSREKAMEQRRIKAWGSILYGKEEHLNDDTRMLRKVMQDSPQLFFKPITQPQEKAESQAMPQLITWRPNVLQ